MLCVGAGGGGDVVGALAVGEQARALGTPYAVGGVTWERSPIDPLPGPRRLDEVQDARPLNHAAAMAGPQTRGPGGFAFAEARMAGVLGTDTLIVDPNPGPAAVAAALADAAHRLDCDLLVLVDVGGDALAAGHEPGLASPLCDAVLLAGGSIAAEAGLATLAAVVGPGCDGELTHDELLRALAATASAGGLLGVRAVDVGSLALLEAAAAAVPTEASAQVIRCVRGERGRTAIRGGRRPLELSALGALTVYVDPRAALESAAPLARAVRDCPSLDAANDVLHDLGIRTELDHERARAATGA